ncbi:hypothetical protein K435DRAFT_449258 [Dendrothele bispora CBS 962.96]|uniref:Uncharacterized protein n=1 Tax=Dendrothele bispora (strain CBS 962.96) TaxID=1314807 RepID=A0A4S8L2A8_DENBC|nr:hypothetical protein K435DRAFT_449258 [Dendrothele bispora CBS 962.96]
MTKGYEKLLASCQQLSELLYLSLPSLPNNARKTDSIQTGVSSSTGSGDLDEIYTPGGKWEDEEERKFYEEVQDLKEFVPKSVLGIEEGEIQPNEEDQEKIKDREARRRR